MSQRDLFADPTPSTPYLERDQNPFDVGASEAAKRVGMDLAKENRRRLLEVAREIAREVALTRQDREISIDPVIQVFRERGYDPEELGNAAGSVFKTADWRLTDRREKATRLKSHSRELKIWRYVGRRA